MNIYLIGYMGCGKTKTGRRLAAHAGCPFTDLDNLFESRFGITIQDYFNRHPEEAFRKEERLLLHETAALEGHIIALGGGTPCFEDNMDWIKRHGVSVYLEMNELMLFQRLRCSHKIRPLLAGLDDDQLLDHICRQLPQRERYYRQADVAWPGLNVEIPPLWQRLQTFQQPRISE
jgi:shikimate kinase